MSSGVVAPVAERLPAAEGKPETTYRYAGERFVLIEYGPMDLDLTLNFYVLAVDEALREHEIEGVIEAAPGFRSILVRYDPYRISAQDLLKELQRLHDSLPAQREMEIPSRRLRLPLALDDSTSRLAVKRYIDTIRDDAPNCEGGNNIDYIVRYNGLKDRDELWKTLLATEQWVGFIGFFPGLAFMFPVDPRYVISVPKYNPTRTWTAEGALGIGGPCTTIYPVESPGGYQIVGRSIRIFDLERRNKGFGDSPFLLRAADRVSFYEVSEEELDEAWRKVEAGEWEYEIEDSPFDVGKYLDWLPEIEDEVRERRARAEAAWESTPVP
jgi:allophanate hydrolase subunit 1